MWCVAFQCHAAAVRRTLMFAREPSSPLHASPNTRFPFLTIEWRIFSDSAAIWNLLRPHSTKQVDTALDSGRNCPFIASDLILRYPKKASECFLSLLHAAGNPPALESAVGHESWFRPSSLSTLHYWLASLHLSLLTGSCRQALHAEIFCSKALLTMSLGSSEIRCLLCLSSIDFTTLTLAGWLELHTV